VSDATDFASLEKYAHNAANNFSEYLISKGDLNYDVYPEAYFDASHHPHIFLNASVPNELVVG
jgi:hypothetical protein